jgi:hypothetical protein
LPSIVSWHVWLEHNKVIFENGSPYICSVVYESLGGIDRHLDSQKVSNTRSFKSSSQEIFTAGWFNVATHSNGQKSGVGGVIRINDQIVFKWKLNCVPGTNTRVGLLVV